MRLDLPAIRAQSFHTPNYSETALSGDRLGLNFNEMNAARGQVGSCLSA